MTLRNRWLPGLLIAAFSVNFADSFPAERRIICQTSAGYEISQVYWLLDSNQFNENSLRELFRPYSELDLLGEWYIVATSDRDYWDAAAHPKFYLGSLHESSVRPLVTDQWVAYFFRVNNNAFFQFGRAGGEIKWVVMRGENIFNRHFESTELRLVGQDFIGPGNEADCSERRRSLVFTSPKVHEDHLATVARYYDRLAAVNGLFNLSIFESPKLAAAYEDVRFPVLEAMPFFERKLAGTLFGQGIPANISYHLNRTSPTEGEFIRYDRDGPGPPTWSQKVSLENITATPPDIPR